MNPDRSLAQLRAYINERWAAIHPNLFQDVRELRVRLAEVTAREAEWFLASVAAQGADPPLFEVQDDNKVRSDRFPPNANGAPRGNVFFERFGDKCSVRLETIVHMAAAWRLHDEFAWPRGHLIVESPDTVDKHGRKLIGRESLDILGLEEPCQRLPSTMRDAEARSRVGVEVKADVRLLDRLLQGMQECQDQSQGLHKDTDHKKCLALRVFRPRLFVGIAAGETWRAFRVEHSDGRAVLMERRDLDRLRFEC